MDAHACPVCASTFALADGAAFALHLADCTSPGTASSPSSSFSAAVVDGVAVAIANGAPPTHACPWCHHVYTSGTAEHVVEFHEYECARANRRKGGSSGSSSTIGGGGGGGGRQQGKRPREPPTTTTTAASEVAAPPLFPSHCALCSAGGRALLQCGGGCARAFHAACLDDIEAGNSHVAAPGVSGLVASVWSCAECARGVRACRACGFLGHESNALTKCSVAGCGVFFHRSAACLPPSASPSPSASASSGGGGSAFVCPRHRCDKCGGVETDMRACVSCTKCFAGTHLRCSASGAAERTAKSVGLRSGAADVHLRVCDAHAGAAKPSADATLALKYRVQQGDLVLVLECANALLPQGAKRAAPDAFNQWGVVTRAEDIDGREQLLTVSLFSDGSVVSVPNRYVLPLGSANAFATPQAMLRDCIKWHAVAELNLRHAELDALLAAAAADGGAPEAAGRLQERRDHILNASCSAFYARAEQLSLSIAQLFSAAKEGFMFWTTHRAELEQFEGSGAPIYVYLDTRPPPKSALADADSGGGNAGDVDMEGAARGDAEDDGRAPDASSAASSSSPSSTTAGAFLRAGTNASRRPLGPGDGGEGEGVSANASCELARTTTAIVSAALSDMVSSVEQGPAAPVNDTSPVALDSVKASAAATSAVISNLDAASVSPSLKATIVDAVEVTVVPDVVGSSSDIAGAKVAFAIAKEEPAKAADDDDAELRAAKRQKLVLDNDEQPRKQHLPQQPELVAAAVAVASVPLPAANTFARAKQSCGVEGVGAATQTPLTRKARVLAEYSPQLLQELARQAAVFLEEDANPALAKRRLKSATPKHCDAFPFASAAESFRPPYFRPSVVFNRAHGRRMDGLSRILLSQDKRNIKCFIQGTDENRCLHEPATATATATRAARSEGTFVTIDLMSVDSFRALDVVIRTRMVAAVEQDDQYLKEIFVGDAARARRLFKEKRSGELAVAVYYCSYDGSRAKVAREKDDWLCFCANVCHLTAVVSLRQQHQ
ncbi:hypothetical protein PybrP1_013025 [[Pythium] brassicae (nom. inval.)]|nr:hypothetical protein PybrP1_013025 [[Pythium] brassicae (nom. inval.)]